MRRELSLRRTKPLAVHPVLSVVVWRKPFFEGMGMLSEVGVAGCRGSGEVNGSAGVPKLKPEASNFVQHAVG